MADWLVNSAADHQVMMNEQFNDKYTQFNETTNFTKLGALNLNRIFFIVSNSTASASELLINNLRPYMDVKLVGPSNTYGKPVGFFPIPVGDWYIFPVSFRSTNKNGEGNYFNGLAVSKQVADGLDKDWGDVNESALSSVLGYINTGVFKSMATGQPVVQFKQDPVVSSANGVLDEPSFKGAVDRRKTL
jgi:carboxyl-terminal processing protease